MLIALSVLAAVLAVALVVCYAWQREKVLTLTERCEVLEEACGKMRREKNKILDKMATRDGLLAQQTYFCYECAADKEKYRRSLLKLSTANRREDLHTKLSSSERERDMARLFEYFDRMFLAVHPDFVDKLNRLLPEDDRLSLRGGTEMPSELRMFALMLLGITDIKRIAEVLGVSVPTIYNYRSTYRALLRPTTGTEDLVAIVESLKEVKEG